MPKIKHVILDYSIHFLVVDGPRGEPTYGGEHPAMHPSGYGRFREDAYGVPGDLKGKVFKLVTEVEAEQETIQQCEPAQKAWKEYSQITDECHRLKIGEYEPA